jgi:AcrR family transcriptional regulator
VPSGRRAELTEAALRYVLTEGLIGLSLRPLAAALGTSDRMLVYHFGGKDALVADVVQLAGQRLADSLEEPAVPPRTPGDLVRYAWHVLDTPLAAGTMRLYLELCVLSLREPGRWTEAHQLIREPWLALLCRALTELGVCAAAAPSLADLVLDTVDGLLLDRMAGPEPERCDAALEAFANLLDGVDRHPVTDATSV